MDKSIQVLAWQGHDTGNELVIFYILAVVNREHILFLLCEPHLNLSLKSTRTPPSSLRGRGTGQSATTGMSLNKLWRLSRLLQRLDMTGRRNILHTGWLLYSDSLSLYSWNGSFFASYALIFLTDRNRVRQRSGRGMLRSWSRIFTCFPRRFQLKKQRSWSKFLSSRQKRILWMSNRMETCCLCVHVVLSMQHFVFHQIAFLIM